MESQEEFDILLEIDGSKRPLSVTRDSAFTAVERELGNLGKDISLLPLGVKVSDQKERSKPLYVLQRWCTKFMTFVDVTDKSDFQDGTRLMVSHLTCSSTAVNNSEVHHM